MITLIVLSYNHREFIVETLNSVYNVNLQKKVIIIDDGSSDGSCEIIEKYIERYNYQSITRFFRKENAGLVDSLNMSLKLIDTEYAFFIASDDIINPYGFTSMFQTMLAHENMNIAIGNAYVLYTGKTPEQKVYGKEHFDFFSKKDSEIRKDIFINFPKPLLLQSTIFKTACLRDVGGWDSKLVWDDYPMFVKLFMRNSFDRGNIFFFADLVVSFYRQHQFNTYKNLLKQLSMVEETFKSIVPLKYYKDAISNQYAFYFLLSLREKNNKAIKKIIKVIVCEKLLFYFAKYFFVHIIKWISRRLSK